LQRYGSDREQIKKINHNCQQTTMTTKLSGGIAAGAKYHGTK